MDRDKLAQSLRHQQIGAVTFWKITDLCSRRPQLTPLRCPCRSPARPPACLLACPSPPALFLLFSLSV